MTLRLMIERGIFLAPDDEGAGAGVGDQGGGDAAKGGDDWTAEDAAKAGDKAGEGDEGAKADGDDKADDGDLWSEEGEGKGEKGDGDGGDDGDDEANEFHGAPENGAEGYEDFTLPEGQEASDELLASFKADAAALNLNQTGAQKLVDRFYEVQGQISQAQSDAWDGQRKAWRDDLAKEVKDIGAFNSQAKAGLDALGATPEFKQFLRITGFADHPDFRRMMAKAGERLGEHRFVEGEETTTTARERGVIDPDRFYGGG